MPINVEGKLIPFSNEVKTLGLTLKRTGIIAHINNRVLQAKLQTNKLKRFNKMREKTKLHLYKALVRPILKYPIIPNAIASRPNMLNMQRVQNKNLQNISRYTDNRDKNVEELHETYSMEPLNIRFHRVITKLWSKLEQKEQQLCNRSMALNDGQDDHYWWKRAAKFLTEEEPEPIYTSL